jgi:hypothetical protein
VRAAELAAARDAELPVDVGAVHLNGLHGDGVGYRKGEIGSAV